MSAKTVIRGQASLDQASTVRRNARQIGAENVSILRSRSFIYSEAPVVEFFRITSHTASCGISPTGRCVFGFKEANSSARCSITIFETGLLSGFVEPMTNLSLTKFMSSANPIAGNVNISVTNFDILSWEDTSISAASWEVCLSTCGSDPDCANVGGFCPPEPPLEMRDRLLDGSARRCLSCGICIQYFSSCPEWCDQFVYPQPGVSNNRDNLIFNVSGLVEMGLYMYDERPRPFPGMVATTGSAIYLSDNGLTSLPPHVFANIVGPLSVNLAHNRLMEIPRALLNLSTTVEQVQLAYNQIGSISHHILTHLVNLKCLNLNHNVITQIVKDSFKTLSKLTILKLNYNHLSTIAPGTFEYLTSLEVLSLQNNILAILPRNLLANCSHLSEIDLTNNRLTSLDLAITTVRLQGFGVANNRITSGLDTSFADLFSANVRYQLGPSGSSNQISLDLNINPNPQSCKFENNSVDCHYCTQGYIQTPDSDYFSCTQPVFSLAKSWSDVINNETSLTWNYTQLVSIDDNVRDAFKGIAFDKSTAFSGYNEDARDIYYDLNWQIPLYDNQGVSFAAECGRFYSANTADAYGEISIRFADNKDEPIQPCQNTVEDTEGREHHYVIDLSATRQNPAFTFDTCESEDAVTVIVFPFEHRDEILSLLTNFTFRQLIVLALYRDSGDENVLRQLTPDGDTDADLEQQIELGKTLINLGFITPEFRCPFKCVNNNGQPDCGFRGDGAVCQRCEFSSGTRITQPFQLKPTKYEFIVKSSAQENAEYNFHFDCSPKLQTVPVDPGGVVIDPNNGILVGAPQQIGSFRAIISAIDGSKQRTVVADWHITVVDPPKFGLANLTGACSLKNWTESVLSSLRNQTSLQNGNRTKFKYDFGTKLDIPGYFDFCNVSNLFDGVDNLLDYKGDLIPDYSFRYEVIPLSGLVTPRPVTDTLNPLVNSGNGRASVTLLEYGIFRFNLRVESGGEKIQGPLISFDIESNQKDTFGRTCPRGEAVEDVNHFTNEPITQNGIYRCNCDSTSGMFASVEFDPVKKTLPTCRLWFLTPAGSQWMYLLFAVVLLFIGTAGSYAYARIHKRKMMRSNIKALINERRSERHQPPSAGMKRKLTDYMFDALLTINADDLALELLSLGADCTARTRDSTNRSLHSIALSRSYVHEKFLTKLFKSHCVIDYSTAKLMEDSEKYQIVKKIFLGFAGEPEYDDKTHTAFVWEGSNETILHRVVDSCRLGLLTCDQAFDLSRALLKQNYKLLEARNGFNRTAGDLSMLCDNAFKLEKLLTVVVYDRFQLIDYANPLYVSPSNSSVVMLCHDIDDQFDEGTDDASQYTDSSSGRQSNMRVQQSRETLVIKMMRDREGWIREIESRSLLKNAAKGVIRMQFAVGPDSDDHAKFMRHRIPAMLYRKGEIEGRRDLSITLMDRHPYAIVMEKADRSLHDIIDDEQLFKEELGFIRFAALKIAKSIKGLHDHGIIHGDIKPRNILRGSNRELKLADLDMSFKTDVTRGQTPIQSFLPQFDNFNRKGAASVFMAPELVKMCEMQFASKQLTKEQAIKGDIWSFGMTLYNMVCGSTLLRTDYGDAADASAIERLKTWKGMNGRDMERINRHHDADYVREVHNLLHWCFHKNYESRPISMDKVLAHSFFSIAGGGMEEQFVIQSIQEELKKQGHRPIGRLMISYSWRNKEFVLNYLAHSLAPLVRYMWLDRLGGEQGMGEWARKSMEEGIKSSDMIIAVVSPSYLISKNCGFEMKLAGDYDKCVIPIVIDVKSDHWPPTRIGPYPMQTQFRNQDDDKLYVEFTGCDKDPIPFGQKFSSELKPRLIELTKQFDRTKPLRRSSTYTGISREFSSDPLLTGEDEYPAVAPDASVKTCNVPENRESMVNTSYNHGFSVNRSNSDGSDDIEV